MICKDCRIAADMNFPLRHKDCPGGTWCDCQHRTGIRAVADLNGQ